MKRLPVFLLLLGLVGCKYPSMEQALEACDEWADKGEKITYYYSIELRKHGYNGYTRTVEDTKNLITRYCKKEEDTKQFLGYQGKLDSTAKERNGKHIGDVRRAKHSEVKDWSIVKHFRY